MDDPDSLRSLRRLASMERDPALRLKGLRSWLDGRRIAVAESFRALPDGKVSAEAISDIYDVLLRVLHESRRNAVAASGCLAFVAVGGYGRRELCPHSDLDLLVLVPDRASKEVLDEAQAIFYPLWDLGVNLGQSVRTLSECLSAARTDIQTTTALLQDRLVSGDQDLYRRFTQRFAGLDGPRSRTRMVRLKLEERQRRIQANGGLASLLEPNIKEGRGALRDLHTLLWLAAITHGARVLDDLPRAGLANPAETTTLRAANKFLLTARFALHLLNPRKTDRLAFNDQPLVASMLGYGENPRESTEAFQRDFYRHVRQVDSIVSDVVHRFSTPVTHRSRRSLDRRFQMIDGRLEVPTSGPNPFINDSLLAFSLYREAQRLEVRVGFRTRELIEQAVAVLQPSDLDPRKAWKCLLAISQESDLEATTLRELHRMGLVALALPDFAGLDCHSEHDIYHLWSTDEHTLGVVGRLADLPRTKNPLFAPYRDELSRVDDPEILFAAAWFHDIGKAVPGNHCVTGAAMALRFGLTMEFGPERSQRLADLVRHHLILNHLAQRRDIEDPSTLKELADAVPDPRTLHMLFVLTACDISSVHPDAWSAWKSSLLVRLHHRTQHVLEEGDLDSAPAEELARLILRVDGDSLDRVKAHLANLPRRYALSQEPDDIRDDMALVDRVIGGTRLVTRFRRTDTSLQLTVVTRDAPGLLARLTGALTCSCLGIVGARVFTRTDGVAIDRFDLVERVDASSSDPSTREADIARALEETLNLPDEDLERRVRSWVARWHARTVRTTTPRVVVEFHDLQGGQATLLDVTGPDRPGLLHDLTHFLGARRWVVHTARVTTEAERAMDTFYLTTLEGTPIPMGPVRDEAQRGLEKLLRGN